jgi:hypothetical protein
MFSFFRRTRPCFSYFVPLLTFHCPLHILGLSGEKGLFNFRERYPCNPHIKKLPRKVVKLLLLTLSICLLYIYRSTLHQPLSQIPAKER